MNLILIAFFTVCGDFVYGQSSCKTSDGGNGECISIYNCPSMVVLLNKKNRTTEETDMMRNAKCGYQGKTPLVCCHTQSNSTGPASCTSPDGKQGKCIGLYSCPHLLSMLKPPVSPDSISYVNKSRCTGPEQYSVCCGSSPSSPSPGAVNSGYCKVQMSAFPPNPKTDCCGVDARGVSMIIGFGGSATNIDGHPWVVMVEHVTKNGATKLICGGVLISGQYVMTAAHCITGNILNTAEPRSVRLGEYDITHEGPDCVTVENGGEDCTEGVIRIPIEKTIPHPEYNPADARRRNDIGLIRLKETAPYTDFIRPICLPSVDLTLQENRPKKFIMYAMGWGAVSTTKLFSPVKVQVELPFVEKDICQTAYRNDGRNIDLWEGQLCAGGKDGVDTCKGDSGGPLAFENGNRYEATGIISFGPVPCGLAGVPGIYTNVYKYLDWITNNIVA